MKRLVCFLSVILFVMAVSTVTAEVGVTDSKIMVGSSAALKGPNGFLGTEFHKGANLVFDEVNAAGGVNGLTISIDVLDDGYEYVRTMTNTNKLIGKKVFCLFGYIGTPTTKSILPIIKAKKVPLFSAFTGAEVLRRPLKKYVLNVRSSYFQETAGLVDHLLNDCDVEKIACFYQDDAYGRAGYEGVKRGLAKYSLEICSEGTYKRNHVAVAKGIADIKKGQPDAVIMVGQYTACSAFIKLAKKSGLKDVYFCNISFVSSDKLNALLGKDAEGAICSQTVPDLANDANKLSGEFIEKYTAAYPEDRTNRVAYEGYISALLFVEGLKQAGKELTRDGFIKAVEGIKDLDIGVGDLVKFSKFDHQGLEKVYYSIVKDGKEIGLTDWVAQAKK